METKRFLEIQKIEIYYRKIMDLEDKFFFFFFNIQILLQVKKSLMLILPTVIFWHTFGSIYLCKKEIDWLEVVIFIQIIALIFLCLE